MLNTNRLRFFSYIFAVFFQQINANINNLPPKELITAREYIQSYPQQCLLFEKASPFPFSSQSVEDDNVIRSQIYPPYFVLSISNARVIGVQGLVITNENQLLRDFAIDWQKTPELLLKSFQTYIPPSKLRNSTVANVTSLGATNYFHWMLNIIPKFALLKKANIVPDYYYLEYRGLKFQNETLQSLGININKIIFAREETCLTCSNLIAPSFVGMVGHPKWIYDFLKELFLTKIDHNNHLLPKRIYIPRKRHRILLNEDQVVIELNKFNFSTIYLEDLEVKEQASLFANAELIVAIHGAGLTNLVFCNEKTRLIELYPPSYNNGCFKGISQPLKIHHVRIPGDQTGISQDNIRLHNFLMNRASLDLLNASIIELINK